MEFYMEAEARELLSTFESAYSMAWETSEDIEQYIEDNYDGNTEQFLFEVAHTCDYFSMATVLKDFIASKKKYN